MEIEMVMLLLHINYRLANGNNEFVNLLSLNIELVLSKNNTNTIINNK